MIFRNDDFDPRFDLDMVRSTHKEFLKRDLIETVCIQVCLGAGFGLKPQVLRYIKETPSYDIQLHCWSHDHYNEWFVRDIIRDLSAAMHYMKKKLDLYPNILYPPYNVGGKNLEEACKYLGLRLDNSGDYIIHFLSEPEAYKEITSVYFHMWQKANRELLPKLLDYFIG